MRLVALETTEKSASLAALEGHRLLTAVRLDPARRSAQSLSAGLRDLLAHVAWRPTDIQLVAVATGPGSFTGLRVGVTTAKTLAYAMGAEVIGVNTLEAIAAQSPPGIEAVWAVIDAQRNQLYAAQFVRAEGRLQVRQPTRIIDVDAWLGLLAAGEAVSGPILARLADRMPSGVTILPAECWAPTAEQIGRLALARYEAGERDDLWQLVPNYFRKSAAEERLEEKLESRSGSQPPGDVVAAD